MNTTFVYDTPVTGNGFIGRRKDVDLLSNFISAGESVVVYGEPGTGCKSLVRKTLSMLRIRIPDMVVAEIDFSKCRKDEDFLLSFTNGLLKACGNSPSEYRQLVQDGLAGTHFVFDRDQYDAHGNIVSLNWAPDDTDIMKVFDLPEFLASRKLVHITMLVNEFQNILFAPDSDAFLDAMEKVIEKKAHGCVYMFTGSHFNRLREIFDVRRCFWHTVERLMPSPVDVSLLTDYVYRNFQMSGKVFEKDLIVSVIQILRGNVRYVNHFFSIVDAMARGYVNQAVVNDAMRILKSIFYPDFFSTVCSLSDYQLSLLKAVVDGETKFSTAGVIEKYGLNSSANVKRLKDALIRKEIVWFDSDDKPHIQDPLFEHWLRQEYFAR